MQWDNGILWGLQGLAKVLWRRKFILTVEKLAKWQCLRYEELHTQNVQKARKFGQMVWLLGACTYDARIEVGEERVVPKADEQY